MVICALYADCSLDAPWSMMQSMHDVAHEPAELVKVVEIPEKTDPGQKDVQIRKIV